MRFDLTDAHKLLASRISDSLDRADRGELVCGNFLTPGEAAISREFLREMSAEKKAFFYGGYPDAERVRMFIVPAYLSDMDGDARELAFTYFPDDMACSVKAIKIEGSGYRKLSHRDYLGSLLALGIERSSIGDIAVLDDFSAVLFCTDKIFGYLMSDIDRIASDKVKCSEFFADEGFSPPKEFLPISDTVASNRLDCVVGALTNLSREKSQIAIRQGLCEVNYLPEDRCDFSIPTPCTVSVRGYGKFKVLSFDGETKRGRLRLVAQKYV